MKNSPLDATLDNELELVAVVLLLDYMAFDDALEASEDHNNLFYFVSAEIALLPAHKLDRWQLMAAVDNKS